MHKLTPDELTSEQIGTVTSNEWTLHKLWPWQKKTLIDGTTHRGGDVMRRRSATGWLYRELTKSEQFEEERGKAW